MKFLLLASPLVSALLVSGCVTIKVPNLVSDTAKVSKDAYEALSEKRKAKRRAHDGLTLSHSYIGNRSQSTAEIKQQCEVEGAAKLRQVGGGGAIDFTVLENEIVGINGAVVANCKLALTK